MWFWYLLIFLFVLEVLACVSCIGDERKPITKEFAAWSIVWHGLLIWGVVYFGILR